MDEIARNVAQSSQESNSHKLFIVGPRANEGEKKHGFFISQGSVQVLNPRSNKDSFILNGLFDATLRICGKINHLLIRDCQQTRIQLESLISGVSILKSQGINLDLSFQNTTFIEETSEARIYGEVTPETLIYISSSMNIKINDEDLMINPFIRGFYTQRGFISNYFIPPEILLLS